MLRVLFLLTVLSGFLAAPVWSQEGIDGRQIQERQQALTQDQLDGKSSPEIYRVKEGDDELTRLKKQRINAAMFEIKHYENLAHAGIGLLDASAASRKRLLAAQLDFHTDAAEIVDVWEQALVAAKKVELIVKDVYKAGAEGVNIAVVCQATYERIDAEIHLHKAKENLAGK